MAVCVAHPGQAWYLFAEETTFFWSLPPWRSDLLPGSLTVTEDLVTALSHHWCLQQGPYAQLSPFPAP